MKLGDIVYFKYLIFKDGVKDKKENRPCIYLFEECIKDVNYVYTIPITSALYRFNKDEENKLVLIPETIFNYKKISFAKVDGIIKSLKKDMIFSNISLSGDTMKYLLRKTIEIATDIDLKGKLEELEEELYKANDYSEPVMVRRLTKKRK